MVTRCTSWAYVAAVLLLTGISTATAKYSGGTGEPNDPYQIATAAALIALGETPADYDKHFILTADIDLDPNLPGRKVFDKAVIAPDTSDSNVWDFEGTPFSGVFDGNGHTISHLTIKGGSYVGLFGRLESGGEVRNLGVVDVNITGSGDYVGGLVGSNDFSTVTWCYSSGVVSGTGSCTGGLVGSNADSHVTTCYSTAAVTGNEYVGGLIGVHYTRDSEVGNVTRCYSTGSVSGNSYVGGLIGGNGFRFSEVAYGMPVEECYSTGAVSGTSFVGGLVGYDDGGTVTTSFWDTQTSGQATSASGTGKTTAEMRDATTFTAARWDFIGETVNGTHEVWQMAEGGGYPALAIFNRYTPPELQGLGTAESPYLISDAFELGAIYYFSPDAHYRLAADIDLGGIRWTMPVIPSLEGTFDGHGHTISHLTIETLKTGWSNRVAGLFGQLVSDAEVRDLGVTDVNIIGSDYRVGALVGSSGSWGSPGGNVTRCYSTGKISGPWFVGGLVGDNGGSITASYSSASVSGAERVGGLVGDNEGSITASYSTGTVNCTTRWSVGGGLVCLNSGSINQCYSTGGVQGMAVVGGLVGANYADGTVTQCYSSGSVSGTDYVGGLVGRNWEGGVASSFWDTQTSGQTWSALGTGKTTAQMQTAKTFLDAGWDFVGETANGHEDIWKIAEGLGYPRLSWQKYSGGTGEPNDPYQIATAADLIALGETPEDYDKHFLLTTDIDLDPNLPGRKVFGRAVIAADTNDIEDGFGGTSFTGVFDGNGHTISRLTIRGDGYLGLFGRLGDASFRADTEVRNLGVVDVNITGSGDGAGGLAGHNSGTLARCYSTGVVRGDRYVGGLVGWASGAGTTMTRCFSTGAVRGNSYVGGLEGRNNGCVTQCYSTGSVTGLGEHVGGLAGWNGWHGIVTFSYSTGGVSGESSVGGLVGSNGASLTGCYSVGAVKGSTDVGGLVGRGWTDDQPIGGNLVGRANACFWDTQTSGQASSAGGTGKTSAEMQTAKTFLDAGEMQTAKTFLDAGWDFAGETANGTADIWKIAEGLDYPRLWWEPYDGRVTVVLGQIFTVTLESNPSTGYRWEWVDRQDSIVEQMGEAQFKPRETGDPPLVGAGGWESFDFKAVNPGQMTLKLVYRRPWEEGVEPLKTFSLQVTVP